jgi:hypothetical protein
MGQQSKQYTTDLLAGCVLCWVLVRFRESGREGRAVILAAAGVIGCFLSFPAVFWFPALVLALLAADGLRGRRWLGLGLFLPGALGLLYVVFLRANVDETLSRYWAGGQLGEVGLVAGLAELERSIAYLLVPQTASWTGWAALIIEVVALAGLVRAIAGFRRGDRTAGTVLLAGPLPLMSGMAVSLAGFYPLLSYPRMILWMLPGLAVLVAYGLEPLFERLSLRFDGLLRYGVPAACLLVVLGSQAVIMRHPRPAEQNREAVEFLRSRGAEQDCVFVYGGMSEPYRYYRRRTGFNPECEFIGNTGWPCCPRSPRRHDTRPNLAQLDLDLTRAAEYSAGRTIWFLLPTSSGQHWGASYAAELDSLPRGMADRGCIEAESARFDQTQVRGYRCGP